MAQQNSGIQTTHQEYKDNLPKWELVDDVIASSVTKYLRNVGACESDPAYAASRQKEYEDGAILMNFTLNTRNGMQGAIFMRPPTVDLPSQLQYLLDNVDGNGLSLEQQAQSTVDQDLRKGRVGLLVDMPSTEEAPTLAQMESGEIAPRIQQYEAQDILNWRTVTIGSVRKLNLIVLREKVDSYSSDPLDDGYFACETNYQYRLLGLDADGYYFQKIYKAAGDSFASGEMVYPRQNGQLMTEIPFYFAGSEDNDYTVDASPLLPIAELNIGHYRNSADTEENSFVCSQAMLVLSPGENMTPEQWAKDNPNGVKVGARRGLNVGAGGSAMFIQAEASDKAQELMTKKEEQAKAIGAQMVSDSAQITAESARIQQGGNTASLSNISNNVTMAYQKALQSCADFLNVSGDIEFKLNQDFFFKSMTAQERAQWVSEVMMGLTPKTLFYRALRESGEYPDAWTDKEIDAAISEQQPMGLAE